MYKNLPWVSYKWIPYEKEHIISRRGSVVRRNRSYDVRIPIVRTGKINFHIWLEEGKVL